MHGLKLAIAISQHSHCSYMYIGNNSCNTQQLPHSQSVKQLMYEVLQQFDWMLHIYLMARQLYKTSSNNIINVCYSYYYIATDTATARFISYVNLGPLIVASHSRKQLKSNSQLVDRKIKNYTKTLASSYSQKPKMFIASNIQLRISSLRTPILNKIHKQSLKMTHTIASYSWSVKQFNFSQFYNSQTG